jgi:phage terminase large subunit-like protein
MYFDTEDVDRKIRFMKKIKHSKGSYAGKNFELFPYQAFITANIIGWKWCDSKERVINTALLMLSRKAGKTFFSVALLLSIIMTDCEQGAEGYMIANSAQQAGIAFTHAKEQCKSLDPNGKIFTRYRSQIRIPILGSTIQILSSDTSKLDGLSPSVFIVDEYHSAPSNENYNILRTGQGSRQNALGIIISSAGFNVGEFPLYEAWQNATEVLSGLKKQDSLFAAIFQLDDEDKFEDENCWIKANPTLGGSISYKFLREQVEQAKNSPSMEVSIKTKNFNIWCNSATTWIPHEQILKCTKQISFDDFKPVGDEEYCCYVGVDLASVNDLTAITYLIEKEGIFYFKTDCYIPDGAIDRSKNRELYRKWIKNGYLKTMHGERANYDEIIIDMLKVDEKVPILQILYDKYNSVSYKQKCEEQGWVTTPYSQTLGSFNMPTKEFERNIFRDKIIIDDNPVVRWAFQNVELKFDEHENCKPMKGKGSQRKIDPIISMLEAYGGYLNNTNNYSTITVI